MSTTEEKRKVKISRMFWIPLGFMMFINAIYLSLEMHKLKVGEILAVKTSITKFDILFIQKLSTLTTLSESLLILVFIGSAVVLLLRKRNPYDVRRFIIVHFVFFLSLYLFSYLLSLLFSVTIGNLAQQLMIPFALLLGILVYHIFKDRKSYESIGM